MAITLTVEQIRDLARFAGLSLSEICTPDDDELEKADQYAPLLYVTPEPAENVDGE